MYVIIYDALVLLISIESGCASESVQGLALYTDEPALSGSVATDGIRAVC